MASSRTRLSVFALAALIAYLSWQLMDFQPSEGPTRTEAAPPSAIAPSPSADVEAGEPMAATAVSLKSTKVASRNTALPHSILEQDSELLAILDAPGSLRDRIRLAISRGGADNAVLREFLYSAVAACDPASLSRLASGPFAGDQTRQWAIGSLVEVCDGFDAREFAAARNPVQADTTPDNVLREFGKEAAAQAALNVIRDRNDFLSLADAGRVLSNADGFPPSLRQSMIDLGIDQRLDAWTHAANLYQCSRSGGRGCGASALSTLSYCASSGCRANSDLRSALSESLPPRQWAAVQAYLQWIEALKRSG